MKKRYVILALLFIIGGFVLVACKPKQEEPTESSVPTINETSTFPTKTKPDPSDSATSIEEFLLLEDGDEVVIQGIITHMGAFDHFSFEDETGAVAIRIEGVNSSNTIYKIGDELKVLVLKESINNLIIANVIGDIMVVGKDSELPLPINLNDLLVFDNEELAQYQSRLVNLDNVIIAEHNVNSNGDVIIALERQDSETILLKWDSRISFMGSSVLTERNIGYFIEIKGATLSWDNGPIIMIGSLKEIEIKNIEVIGELYHWIPGAINKDTGLIATVDLSNTIYDEKTGDGLIVNLLEKELVYKYDYEIVGSDKLVVYGQTLDDFNLDLGNYELFIQSNNYTGRLVFYVVNNASNTSISTKEISVVDMSKYEAYSISAPIENAPDLLITEVGLDRSKYDFIEVFNNTDGTYNLKNHMLTFFDLNQQDLSLSSGVFHISQGARSSKFIDVDFLIPALSHAYIWVLNGRPWETIETNFNPNITHEVSVISPELLHSPLLNKETFINEYKLTESTPVLMVRLDYTLFDNTDSYNHVLGLGNPIEKQDNWISNSSLDNRGVQIQKIDIDLKYIPAPEDGIIPTGASYYKVEFGRLNKEEDVINIELPGYIDKSKIMVVNKKESINAFYVRKVFYDSLDNLLGYSVVGDNEFNIADMTSNGLNSTRYKTMINSSVKVISTALFYPRILEDGTKSKWNEISLEYAIPKNTGSGINTLMRFIQRGNILYSFLSQNPPVLIKIMGLLDSSEFYIPYEIVEVPINDGYPIDAIIEEFTTIGRVASFNLTVY